MIKKIKNNVAKHAFLFGQLTKKGDLCDTNLKQSFYLRNCTYWKLIKRSLAIKLLFIYPICRVNDIV